MGPREQQQCCAVNTASLPPQQSSTPELALPPNDVVLVQDIFLLIYFTFHPVALRTTVPAAAVARVDACIKRSSLYPHSTFPPQQARRQQCCFCRGHSSFPRSRKQLSVSFGVPSIALPSVCFGVNIEHHLPPRLVRNGHRHPPITVQHVNVDKKQSTALARFNNECALVRPT